MTIETLVECWRLSGGDHRFEAPASRQAIASAETELGRPLPPEMQELFAVSDGLLLFGGNLHIYPLRKAEDPLSLVAVTGWLRECGWHIPDDVVIFGDTGSDGLFGLWVGEGDIDRFPSPVVQVGEIFEDGCLALVATNFLSFLAVETVISALMDEDEAVLGTFPVPKLLAESGEVTEAAIRRWADPSFPEASADPYESRLDCAGLRKLMA